MSSTRSKVPRSVIGNYYPPESRLGRLIEYGTGLSIPAADPSDPLAAFEARQVSWRNAQPHIEELEAIKGSVIRESINRDLLRFAVLRLADLALIAHRVQRKTPVRLSTITKRLNSQNVSPDEAFTLLHLKAEKSPNQRTRVPGRPSNAKSLSVLSGLAWHIYRETERPHFNLLVTLLKCIYPPIFIIPGTTRDAWRQLSDAISKHRDDDGEKDYKELSAAMAQALQARHLSPSR